MGNCKSNIFKSQSTFKTENEDLPKKVNSKEKKISDKPTTFETPRTFFQNTMDSFRSQNDEKIKVNSDVLVNVNSGNPEEIYRFIKLLGEGSYGTVWKVKHNQLKITRALKKIKKPLKMNERVEKEILSEIQILKTLDHPNIVKLYEFFNKPDAFYLVTEFCKEGELFQQIIDKAPFDEYFTAYIMYQLISAIHYCHSNNVMHRDLKPENILIESKENDGLFRIKVIDFGTAKILEKNEVERKLIGSAYYIAPEVLKRSYNQACDLWSCGVIMYILLSGHAPFSGQTDNEILQKISIGIYDLKAKPWPHISKEAKDLISKLLERDYEKRITAKEALNHLWFKTNKTNKRVNNIRPENIKKLLNNLVNFRAQSKLQMTALAYLVHNIPPNEEIKDAYCLFNLIDENSDGCIQKNELYLGLKQLLFNDTDEYNDDIILNIVNKIFENIDSDNSGKIEYEEFVRGSIDFETLLTEENLRFVFAYFDKDGSGEITVEELKVVFGEYCEDLDVLEKMISEIDVDCNQTIDYSEFKSMMLSLFS